MLLKLENIDQVNPKRIEITVGSSLLIKPIVDDEYKVIQETDRDVSFCLGEREEPPIVLPRGWGYNWNTDYGAPSDESTI